MSRVEGRGSRVEGSMSRVEGTMCLLGGKSPSVKLMYRRENKELNQPRKHRQNHAKITAIGSIKDLRPQRDSVSVRSSVSGLKSECPDNFSSEPDLWFALRDFVPE